MKNVMKNLRRDDKGAALIMALILLLIGGLISAALLNHMGSGILAGVVHERRTTELYAADAGVEDAIWKIQHGETAVCPGDPYWSYNLTDINGKEVEISIEYLPDDCTYRVTSMAVTEGDSGGVASIDSATAIEAYVSVLYMDLSSLLDHAIVSDDTIDIMPGSTVDGDVWLPDEENLNNKGDITGDIEDNDDVAITWPTYEQLSAYYYGDVEGTYDPGPSINIEYTKSIGPCYREGDFAVDSTGDPDTLVLDGTVYITGDLEFQQSGASKDYTINLNGETIFVEGSIDFASDHITISGSGCIIAVGDVNFQPSIASGRDDFVFVFSISGEVWFHPNGDFTGCVAGNVHVELSPNNEIYWTSPEGKGLNVPWGVGDGDELPPITGLTVESWEITQQ
jgi:hypothetical protein